MFKYGFCKCPLTFRELAMIESMAIVRSGSGSADRVVVLAVAQYVRGSGNKARW